MGHGMQALLLVEPAGDMPPEGQALHEFPFTFRNVLMGHGMHALMLVDPAGEVAPREHAMHELPVR